MSDSIKFKAVMDSVRVDKDGEVKLSLRVPLTYRNDALLCAALTEKVLRVTITPETQESPEESGKDGW